MTTPPNTEEAREAAEALHDAVLARVVDSSGDLVNRRRSGLARSLYLAIMAAALCFTTAVGVTAAPPVEADVPVTSVPLPVRGEMVGLTEAPSATAGCSGQPLPVQADDSLLASPTPSERPASIASSKGATQTEADARGAAALALISYPWQAQLPEWTITFHPPKKGLYGLTLVSEKRIEIYLRDGETQALLAHVIAHEIGHAVDVSCNDGPNRRVWSEARELGSAPWWPGDGATDFSTGAGDFAESFAVWQVGPEHFRSKLADPPTDEQLEILSKLATEP